MVAEQPNRAGDWQGYRVANTPEVIRQIPTLFQPLQGCRVVVLIVAGDEADPANRQRHGREQHCGGELAGEQLTEAAPQGNARRSVCSSWKCAAMIH
jgi:hypothetical protein